MKIGIIIYSQTGRTVNVARSIASHLREKGNEVDILMLRTKGQVHPGARDFVIANPPELDEFDTVLFGTPVWAFNAAPVVPKYLASIETLKKKKVLPFAVMGLPFSWTGGQQALNKLTELCVLNGANVCEGEMFHYAFRLNQEKLKEVADRIEKKLNEE